MHSEVRSSLQLITSSINIRKEKHTKNNFKIKPQNFKIKIQKPETCILKRKDHVKRKILSSPLISFAKHPSVSDQFSLNVLKRFLFILIHQRFLPLSKNNEARHYISKR